VAGADGRIDPAEVKTLQKIYKLLELDPGSVFGDIHALGGVESAAVASEPVTVRPSLPSRPGYAVPKPPEEHAFLLDMALVKARMEETEEVSKLLSEIFVEDETSVVEERESITEPVEPLEEVAEDVQPQATGPASRLDSNHATLLKELMGRSSISRSDFVALVAQHDLMPDGAIDTLNEAAIETCEEYVLDGNDPIEVNPHVLEELLA
jgi:hypothetical protein